MKNKALLAALSAALLICSGCANNPPSASQAESSVQSSAIAAESTEEKSAAAEESLEASTVTESEDEKSKQASQTESRDEQSTAVEESAESQTSVVIIEENDPLKNEKEIVLKNVRLILDSEDFQSRDPISGLSYMQRQLSENLRNENVEFIFSTQQNGIYGTFDDGTKWGFLFEQVPEYNEEESCTQEEMDNMLDIMQKTDDRITEVTKSDEYQNASDEEKIEIVRKLLEKLSDEGLIKNNYIINEEMASFEYAGGGSGGIKFKPFDPMFN